MPASISLDCLVLLALPMEDVIEANELTIEACHEHHVPTRSQESDVQALALLPDFSSLAVLLWRIYLLPELHQGGRAKPKLNEGLPGFKIRPAVVCSSSGIIRNHV